MSFGYALGKLRQEKGLSLRRLGELADVDYSFISRLESGQKQPSAEIVCKLSRGLSLTDHSTIVLQAIRLKQCPSALVDLFLEERYRPVLVLRCLIDIYQGHSQSTATKELWRRRADHLQGSIYYMLNEIK